MCESESERDAEWPEFEGTLLTYSETAVIGTDPDGHYVRERFMPGSLTMPHDDAPVLVNRQHERSRVVGHLTSVSDVGDKVHVRGVLVDTVQDGYESIELAKARSVANLSVEFMSLG